MPNTGYILTAIFLAAGITFALRLIPFGIKSALKGNALVENLSQWVPMGAIICLGFYVLVSIDYSSAHTAIPYLAGSVTTAGLHLWRRNLALSLVAGTAVCVILSTWVF
ncbi:AzlD domain-containing protein [Rothia sp. (in: high G+C Gram-positive bacteria)]|uniref:branched-chain amino acid transporter permease n=1 Tax=Rothia sp. (in: high G+C Gram-positive bacteria) TaxID=1885016 RepID=UPI0009CA120F|nr:Putative branched-chain amino acid transport protein [Mycobacteroides abscessus subsp. bolletii]